MGAVERVHITQLFENCPECPFGGSTEYPIYKCYPPPPQTALPQKRKLPDDRVCIQDSPVAPTPIHLNSMSTVEFSRRVAYSSFVIHNLSWSRFCYQPGQACRVKGLCMHCKCWFFNFRICASDKVPIYVNLGIGYLTSVFGSFARSSA